ncbi:hypothetical protein TNCV_3998321 [Trichonephila clavipes]|nr:hypothetical protein TNCV_3998321 [Trichonephila clavipes]
MLFSVAAKIEKKNRRKRVAPTTQLQSRPRKGKRDESRLTRKEREDTTRRGPGWSTRRVAGRWDRSGVPLEIVGTSGHEKVPISAEKPGLERPEDSGVTEK